MSVSIDSTPSVISIDSENKEVSVESSQASVDILPSSNTVGVTPIVNEVVIVSEKGDTGAQGPQGIQGDKGDQGIQGPQGEGISARQGFIDYNDSSTASNPLLVSKNVWTVIPNDGLGSFTNKSYLPSNVTELMDVSNGSIDPRELSLGDVIIIRNDFTITPQTNNASLMFRYTLGYGVNSYTLEKRLGRLDEGSGIPYRFSLTTDKIYMGDSNTNDNLIGLELYLSTDGLLVNSGTAISVIKYEV